MHVTLYGKKGEYSCNWTKNLETKGLSWIICINSKCSYEYCFKVEVEEDLTDRKRQGNVTEVKDRRDVVTSQEILAAARSWKRQRTDSTLVPLKLVQPYWNSDFSLAIVFGFLASKIMKEIISIVLVTKLQQAKETNTIVYNWLQSSFVWYI